MNLAARLESFGDQVVSVAGLAKNCGKTTTVNHLIRSYATSGVRLGLTSIGRDGEQEDLITRQPKPRIHVERETLAITTEQSLAQSSVAARILQKTDMKTAMGCLVLIEVQSAGLLELSGPSTMVHARSSVALLKEAGAERIIIDGALDRLSCCSPSVCGSMVLSVGAVLGNSVESVAAKVAHHIQLLLLPELDCEALRLLSPVAERSARQAAAIGADGSVTDLDGSALTCSTLTNSVDDGCRWLWCGGGITDSVVDSLINCRSLPHIVAQDATRVFLSPMSYNRWKVAGGKIFVLEPIRLRAITTNPTRPDGHSLDANELIDKVADAASGIPVYDVTARLSANIAPVLDGCEACSA